MSDTVRKIITLLVALIVVGLLFFGIYKILGMTDNKDGVGSIFGVTEINVTASSYNIKSGENVVVRWDNKEETDGQYSITYSCTDKVEIQLTSEGQVNELICDRPFSIGSKVSSVTLKPKVIGDDNSKDIDVIVSYTPNGATKESKSGKVTITVKGSDETAEETETPPVTVVEVSKDKETATSTTPRTTTTPKPTYFSPADLTVTNITRINDRSFYLTVKNIGGKVSGNWSFTYTTPTSPSKTMYSPYQPSLHPNQYIVLKVAFDEVENNSSTVLVRLNQNGAVLESNYTNNSAQIVLSSSHSYNNSLYLTCTVTDTSIERGEYVTYYANVSGGKSPYSYRWSGDFTGYYRAMRVKYNDDGRQEVEVKVSDRNGNTITKECPDVYVDEDSYNNDDADLVINDFEFGYINSSGYFVEDYSIDEDDNAAVRIQIENDGEDFNDKWRFEIKENGYVLYRSPYYAGLDEGDKFDLELALTRIYEGDYELTLEVDSSDNVDESNENNNRKSIDISIRD